MYSQGKLVSTNGLRALRRVGSTYQTAEATKDSRGLSNGWRKPGGIIMQGRAHVEFLFESEEPVYILQDEFRRCHE